MMLVGADWKEEACGDSFFARGMTIFDLREIAQSEVPALNGGEIASSDRLPMLAGVESDAVPALLVL